MYNNYVTQKIRPPQYQTSSYSTEVQSVEGKTEEEQDKTTLKILFVLTWY